MCVAFVNQSVREKVRKYVKEGVCVRGSEWEGEGVRTGEPVCVCVCVREDERVCHEGCVYVLEVLHVCWGECD